jgi:predicted nucleotidyltransferase
MAPIGAVDLSQAIADAVELSERLGQPPVLAGALAMAAHGYRRETSDVDIVIPVVIGTLSGDAVEEAAREMGMTVRAKHGFGGLDLRDREIRIDVLTLDRDMPALIPDAVKEAVASRRTVEIYGHTMFVVSLGHLIAMKLIAERKKDMADIVELIKARIELGKWSRDSSQVRSAVKQHLGWYAAKTVDGLAATAQEELRD